MTPAPDRIRLGFEQDDAFTVLAELDSRYLSTEVTEGFTGRVIGVYATAGSASFDWFDGTRQRPQLVLASRPRRPNALTNTTSSHRTNLDEERCP